MDVLLFEGRNRWKFFSLFRQIQLGKSGHLAHGLARTVRGRSVTVRLETYPVEVHVDGDASSRRRSPATPLTATVSILVPGEETAPSPTASR